MKKSPFYSIKNKLNLIILSISSITLLIACSIFVLSDRQEFKKSMSHELFILANIIGDRSSAALLFDDKQVVKETLLSLKAKKTIVQAIVYNKNNALFAQYNDSISDKKLTTVHAFKPQKKYQFSDQFLEIWDPIIQGNEFLGMVYIKSDLSRLNKRLNYFIKIILIIFTLTLFIAYLLAIQLQRIITKPISHLVKTAHLIAKKEDYSLRAVAHENDEIGQLIIQFNTMIEQVQTRDKELQTINCQLEQRVYERTLELSQSNQHLIKAKELADAGSKAKSEFLANMSHEIRTPMNGVLTTSELLLSQEVAPRIRSYLEIINTSAFSLLRIINEILDFSKIEAGKLNIENKAFFLSHIFDQLPSLFMSKINEKKIELLFDIDPLAVDHLCGDVMRIQQILTNLIANALKFTPTNGIIICGTQVIKQSSKEIELRFFVKDTGIGIAANKISQLFVAFAQADSSTTRKYGGTGLGLSICKQLVELMEGSIGVESELGKGSHFFFNITFEIASQPNTLKTSLPTKVENLTVLIVDDQKISLNITKNLIESLGFKSICANSGNEAIQILKKHPQNKISIVLIDWLMPKLNGLETAMIIREKLAYKKPLILMSAFEKSDQLRNYPNLSINAFLQKPLRQSTLFDTIMQLYSKKSPILKNTINKSNAQLYAKDLSGNSILVAEDNLTNQQVILALFDNFDVSITLVNNGQEALDAVRQQRFDAILMDMQMPVMDGYEAIRIIRKRAETKATPIIALTANAMQGDEEKCMQAGSSAYITKPINQEQLFRSLSRFLHCKKASQQPPIIKRKSSLEESEWLADVMPGLQINEAIKQLNISKKHFKKILKQFYSQYSHKIIAMSQLIKNKQWEQLRDSAHDIKGSGANIGAYKLQKSAAKLELDCNDEVEISLLENDFFDLKINLEQVLSSIAKLGMDIDKGKKINTDNNTQVERNKTKMIIKVDKTCLLKTVANLYKALEETNPVKIRNLTGLIVQQLQHPQLNALENQIENFDFEDAIETLASIKSSIS